MKGTARGDFSRLRFDPRRRFSSVRMQQGRVQLDADWNEQADLVEHRLRTALTDLVGESGAPVGSAGFRVTPGSLGLELGTGGHFVLVGGASGFRLPEEVGPGEDLEAALEVVPASDGIVASLWSRSGDETRFGLVWGLQLEGSRLRLRREDGDNLVSPPTPRLHGHPHRLAVRVGPRGTTLGLDGRTVAADATGGPASGSDLLLLVGSRREPRFRGLLAELRLRSAGSATSVRELGHWDFGGGPGEGGVDRVPDRGTLGIDAVVRGEGPPRARRLPLDLELGAGRYYVDGVAGEMTEPSTFRTQPDLPGAELPLPASLEPEHHVLYLDLWERTVDAAEDPDHLLESALGGADTAVRTRVMAQVRSVPWSRLEEGSEAGTADPTPADVHARWRPLRPPLEERGRLTARIRQPATQRLEDILYRVEVHEAGDGAVARASNWEQGRRRLVLAGADGGWEPGQAVVVAERRHGAGPGRPARVERVEEDGALVLDRELEGLHLPLEVRRLATFKWARHNASHTFPVTELEMRGEEGLVVLDRNARGLEALRAGAWVELVDDATAVGALPPVLHRISSMDLSRPAVVLEAGDGAEPSLESHPRLRLWDQPGADATLGGALTADPDEWHELEAGIQVRFAYDAPYLPGDFWLLTARSFRGGLDWPRDEQGLPRPEPPRGVGHHASPLALLSFRPDGLRITDLRRTFHPHAVDAVRKDGDWMDGPLDVRADLRVGGDLEVDGDVRGERLYGRLAEPRSVDEPQLADGAVSRRTLAAEVGLVPDHHLILGPRPEAPPGYEATQWVVGAHSRDPHWVDLRELPAPVTGPLVGVALAGRVYTLLESGEVWCYDPLEDVWQRRPGLPLPLRDFSAAVLGERIFIVGGLDDQDQPSAAVLEYDPDVGTWAEHSDLPEPRSGLALVVCEGRLHALGGTARGWFGLSRASRRHDVYDPVTGTWSTAPPLPRFLAAAGAAVLEGRIHVVGGERRGLRGYGGRSLASDHLLYDTGSEVWRSLPSALPLPRQRIRLVEMEGALAAVGGRASLNWLDECDLFDPAQGGWVSLPRLHERVEGPAVAAVDGTLYVTGARVGPGAGGVLVEALPLRTRFHVHRRRRWTADREPEPAEESFDLPRLEDDAGV